MGSGGADFLAFSAEDAVLFIKGHLRSGGKGFGVVAPAAAERAALQEKRGPDSGTVVYGKVADVRKNGSPLHHGGGGVRGGTAKGEHHLLLLLFFSLDFP